MRYDEIRSHVRDHFRELLGKFKENVAKEGPKDAAWEDSVKNMIALRDETVENWADLSHSEGLAGVVQGFCDKRGIKDALSDEELFLVAGEYQKGSSEYFVRTLEINESLQTIEISDLPTLLTTPSPEDAQAQADDTPTSSFEDVVEKYLSELTLSGGLAAKTESEKRSALALLGEATENKPPANMTKRDAQRVKEVLLNLPKNRSKSPELAKLSLKELVTLGGVETISPRTANAYISAMQTFFGWAVLDLSRNCAAPLNTYRVAKENRDGITTEPGVPR